MTMGLTRKRLGLGAVVGHHHVREEREKDGIVINQVIEQDVNQLWWCLVGLQVLGLGWQASEMGMEQDKAR